MLMIYRVKDKITPVKFKGQIELSFYSYYSKTSLLLSSKKSVRWFILMWKNVSYYCSSERENVLKMISSDRGCY
jgi:hypothetical protein